ncbi:hypothetical protein [Pseudofulvibacter geojedonensis]|uniref:JmjC domain-containing protein n=1 Tax=Pseudofulvibacter geojedonensis TaxID=1123758 RepID=A0ABW3I1K1_9FLAO
MQIETEQKIKSFSKEWWEYFIDYTGNMTVPSVVKNTFNNDVGILRESIFEMLQNLKKDKSLIPWRVWVEGELDKGLKDRIIKDPVKSEDDFLDWEKRHFGNKKYGIILNTGQRYSEKGRDVISEYFKPFLKDNTPFGGINFSIFIGNYGWTPIGIHEDHTGSFVMHFHLGPGSKTMYMWDRANYKESLEGGENNDNPEKYLPFADYKCDFTEGDVFFMPWNYYHIGRSDQTSLGLTVWFNYTTVDGLLNGVWESGLKEVNGENLNDELLVSNVKDVGSIDDIDITLSKLDEDKLDETLKEFIYQELDDYSGALKSSDWYDSGDIKDANHAIEINEDMYLRINKSSIHYRQDGDSIKLFHRGDKVSFHNHDDIIKLVSELNNGKEVQVKKLLSGLFQDWPDGIGVRLLEILLENSFLQIINV